MEGALDGSWRRSFNFLRRVQGARRVSDGGARGGRQVPVHRHHMPLPQKRGLLSRERTRAMLPLIGLLRRPTPQPRGRQATPRSSRPELQAHFGVGRAALRVGLRGAAA